MSIPRILVVGGGASGIELVTTLGKKLGKKGLANIYLADGTPTHVWKPLLHEMATGALNVGEDEVNYFSQGSINGFRFHYGWINGLDKERKVVITDAIHDLEGNEVSPQREFKYDKLVLAVGAKTNSFGTPGVEEQCYKLDSQCEAERLRKRFLGSALQLAFQNINKIRIGIVGAGPTGVELAAEIHHAMMEIQAYGATIPKDALELTILEAAPNILPGTPPHMSEFAKTQLTNRGIQILTGTAIKEINDKGFVIGENRQLLEKDIKIWSAGIKAAEWLKNIGLQNDNINRVKVNEYLETEDPDIYAMGDCSHCPDPGNDNRPCPATAQCAHQQADYLAIKIMNDIQNKPTSKPFRYKNQGMLVSLGTTTAVGSLQGITKKCKLKTSGRQAKFLYSTLYRMHQAAIYGPFRAGMILIGDRLRSASMPALKLH